MKLVSWIIAILAGAFALSLAVDAFGLALVFAADGSILLMAIVIASVSVVVAVPAALRNGVQPVGRTERRALTAVFASGVLYSAIVWWAAGPVNADGFFHLARARKLADLDVLNGLSSVDEFKDGGLHPGYAFPLWHAVDALVARLAGVDVAEVLVYLPAILVPLALLLAADLVGAQVRVAVAAEPHAVEPAAAQAPGRRVATLSRLERLAERRRAGGEIDAGALAARHEDFAPGQYRAAERLARQ